MTYKFVIGIDPGLSGAIAMLTRSSSRVNFVADMPIEPKSARNGNQVDALALLKMLNRLRNTAENWPASLDVYIEKVNAMPGQGVVSMFNFGEGCGIVRGVVATTELPYAFVTPNKWKKVLGLSGHDKQYALTIAKQLHPELADRLTRKKDVGRADAILIAHYALHHTHT